MEYVFPLFARLLNETGHSLDFSVEEGRCPIPSPGPRRRRLVNLSKLRKSGSWSIKVSIDKNLTEMTLEPRNFFDHAQILFKFEENGSGLIFIAEGIKDKDICTPRRLGWNIGFVLRKKIIFSGIQYSPIKNVLLEFPMNMQQTSDVAVVPEAIVNSNKRSPLRKEESPHTEADHSVKHIKVNPPNRKEESPQTEADHSVKHIKVNPPKRENDGKAGTTPKSQQRESKDCLKKRFSDKMNITKEESPQTEIDDFVKHIKMNPSKRKRTATYTPLDGSRHDTFETKISNSSHMEPLHRQGNSPDFCCHHRHYQQQLTEHLGYEHDHPPHSFHVPNKDTTDRIFMLLCAILVVGLVHMLLLGYQITH